MLMIVVNSVITPGVDLHYSYELSDFALHHQNPDLLNDFAQSTFAV